MSLIFGVYYDDNLKIYEIDCEAFDPKNKKNAKKHAHLKNLSFLKHPSNNF